MEQEHEQMALYITPAAIDKRETLCTSQAVHFVFVRLSDSGKILNPSDSSFENPFAPFADLSFRAQWDSDKPEKAPYGWDVEYRSVYSVDTQRARVMLKTLEKLDRIKARFPVAPSTFGQFVKLICDGLKVRKIVRPSKGYEFGGGWSYSDTPHNTYDTKDAEYMVDDLIRTAREPQPKD